MYTHTQEFKQYYRVILKDKVSHNSISPDLSPEVSCSTSSVCHFWGQVWVLWSLKCIHPVGLFQRKIIHLTVCIHFQAPEGAWMSKEARSFINFLLNVPLTISITPNSLYTL